MIFLLDKSLGFPDPRLGEPDGLFAIGGDISVERLLLAYSHGIFPWYPYKHSELPYWYCPLERFVIFPKEIHISHSMRNLINKNIYEVTFNKDFEGVIRNCSKAGERNKDENAWLGEKLILTFIKLHHLGYAESVEVWENKKLVGGLYGMYLNDVFIGESMFSFKPSASKLALISLANEMEKTGGKIIDCQFETPHLKSMGGKFISYEEYMDFLKN